VLTFYNRFFPIKTICSYIALILLSIGLVSCGDRLETSSLSNAQQPKAAIAAGKLLEVAPPSIIQELHQSSEQYQPQVTIVSPQSDRTFDDTKVEVKLQVRDLPIFKDPQLELGNHLKLILDNEPAQEIYNLDEPILLENLNPGTHTIRVFASRPWHESFKNDGAYAQTTFHILTKTNNNQPNSSLPLLTYSYPKGSYGAEPILLDFYLTNAPLHLVAQQNPEDEIADWRIRVTVNGESFTLDNWQPIYLTGFEKGNNWVQLEFLDEKGNVVNNAFNNTVRLITYNPKGQDSLSKLVRGELTTESARAIVEPGYRAKLTPTVTPTPTLTPTPEETPLIEPEIPQASPTPIETPSAIEEPEPEVFTEPSIEPRESLIPQEEPQATELPKTIEMPTVKPEPIPVEPSVEPTVMPSVTDKESSPVEITPSAEIPSKSKKVSPETPQWFNNIMTRLKQPSTAPNFSQPEPAEITTEPNEQSEVIEPTSEAM
jgi:hypothetical protein